MTATNKRLLISESHDNLNRCTPYGGKPNQHDTYASHASPHTPGVGFLWVVPVCGNLSRDANRFGQIPLLPRKRAPDTIHSTPADLPNQQSMPSFSRKPVNEAGGVSHSLTFPISSLPFPPKSPARSPV
jgi:hypothetical protein